MQVQEPTLPFTGVRGGRDRRGVADIFEVVPSTSREQLCANRERSSKAKMSTRARRTLPPRTPVKGSVGSPSLAETAAKGGRKGERNVVECTEEDAGTTNQYEAARLVSPQPSMSRLASQARMAHHSCPFAQNHEPLTLSVPAG